jgi:asparagine synthetase B (glutamine-hydrolysing)
MSAFLLVWHREGGTVPPSLLALVPGVPAAHRRVAPRVLERPGIAAWHWPGAWAPDAEARLPLEHAGSVGSGVLRLDDRTTLTARLREAGIDLAVPGRGAGRGAGVAGTEGRHAGGGDGPMRAAAGGHADDATLAWASCAAWGDDAPARWSGDFAVALVPATRDRLLVARGCPGVRSAFHASAGPFACASDDPALLAAVRSHLGDAGGVDETAIAEYLRFGHLVTPTRSFHEGVARVPAGHTLRVARDGSTRLVRHWEWPAPATRYARSEGEVVEEFGALLAEAIRDRMRGAPTALLLSGGLDSPALGWGARRAGVADELRAITVSWARLIPDPEGSLARRAAEALGLRHEVLAYTPDEGLGGHEAFVTPEPVPDAEVGLWRSQSRRLSSVAQVLLNGEDMDALLAAPSLLDQLRSEGVARTAVAWRDFRRETGRRPWLGFGRAVPVLGSWRERRASRAPRWLRREATARLLATAGSGSPPRHPTRPRAVRSLAAPTWEGACWLEDPAMNGTGLVTLLPFMDRRLIAFCFALPPVPWTQRKHLLRVALRGVLPPELLERAKSPLRGYYEARVAAWRAVGAPIAGLPARLEAYVDPVAWHRALSGRDGAHAVLAAWRVSELARWLAQSPPAGGLA